MTKEELKRRTQKYGLDIIKFLYSLPKEQISNALSNHLVRSATSIGANYRATLRARSGKEFIGKMGVIPEEADEALYWLEIMHEIPEYNNLKIEIKSLMNEVNELTAIFASALKTLKANHNS